MLDLRSALGAPPLVFPRVSAPQMHAPSGMPGSAPLMNVNQAAAAHVQLGCVGCPAMPMGAGIGAIEAGWWSRVPLWVKIGGGLALAGGGGYLVYRLLR